VDHDRQDLRLDQLHADGHSRRWAGLLIVLLVASALGLAVPKPAVAATEDESPSPTTGTTDVVAPGLPESPVDPTSPLDAPATPAEQVDAIEDAIAEAADQIEASVEAEAGNVNVSVRVLSPGVDGVVSQEPGSVPVISDSDASGITPATETGSSTSSPESTTAAVDGNTNVNVRVLSPGDNGPVEQTGWSVGVASTDGTKPTSEEAQTVDPKVDSAADDTAASDQLSDGNSARYQSEDSQYQSGDDATTEPWYWSWEFSIDCGGTPASRSTETGDRSSLIWTWDWDWNWACTDGDTARSPPGESAGPDGSSSTSSTSSTSSGPNTNVFVRVLSPGDNGPVRQTNSDLDDAAAAHTTDETADSAGGSWIWSMTFTFCDRTTTLSTQGPSDTPLTWSWSWTWNWSCDSAVGAPPVLEGVTPAASESPGSLSAQPAVISAGPGTPNEAQATVQSPEPPLPASAASLLPSVDVVTRMTDLAIEVTVEVELPPHLNSQTEPSPTPIELSLPSVDAGLGVSVVVAPIEPATARLPRRAGSSGPGVATTSIPVPSATRVTSQPSTPSSRSSLQKPKQPISARPAPRNRRTPLRLLDELPSTPGAGSGTLGGRVPSTPIAVVAALLAFFMLAAPNLGRRIRVARELSPRSAYRSSIDHPG
jgi:hypothetical protein